MNPQLRKPLIAGNWKMYKTIAETQAFFDQISPHVFGARHCEMVIAAPFTALRRAAELGKELGIGISAQNLHWEAAGAFTGEISAAMLREAGCRFTLIGHSERRQFFGETDQIVRRKLQAALAAGLQPIVCIGESLAERESGQTEAVLDRQLSQGLDGLTEAAFSPIIIAYEPVWAIGTGRTATPEIAQQAHAYIRSRLARLVSPAAAERCRILYGGSVKPENIAGLMAQPDVDGALVGGASLDPRSFAAIVHYDKAR
ncbi:MAG TPA: triose-phosphate isomerase [Terriglobia bacterium]|nr:triose-phosphate isomerase [Terriglobia bacterium]